MYLKDYHLNNTNATLAIVPAESRQEMLGAISNSSGQKCVEDQDPWSSGHGEDLSWCNELPPHEHADFSSHCIFQPGEDWSKSRAEFEQDNNATHDEEEAKSHGLLHYVFHVVKKEVFGVLKGKILGRDGDQSWVSSDRRHHRTFCRMMSHGA